MMSIEKSVLEATGFGNTSLPDYWPKTVVLRDGREAVIWIHRHSGHGILDPKYWESQEFYSEDYRKQFSAEIGRNVKAVEHLKIYNGLNEKQFRTFAQHLDKKTKFLEIGCSFGGILKRAANCGVAICHAVEPNRKDAEFVRESNPQAEIFNTAFENTELQENFYDIVVSIEVLEHVVSPRKFLEKCFNVLKNGGIIHLEVPNHNDVLLSTYENKAYKNFYYHKAHIHHFTEDSLKLLCKQCGFEGQVSSFLMYPFFNHVWWTQNQKPQLSAVSALATLQPTGAKTTAKKAINEFYKKTEQDYEKLINSYMLGDCLIFQGKKK
jgi:2-polyprenyl-3-methyl-5-hydroxy-6-metoxy-1,4-benzoquinol methylase